MTPGGARADRGGLERVDHAIPDLDVPVLGEDYTPACACFFRSRGHKSIHFQPLTPKHLPRGQSLEVGYSGMAAAAFSATSAK